MCKIQNTLYFAHVFSIKESFNTIYNIFYQMLNRISLPSGPLSQLLQKNNDSITIGARVPMTTYCLWHLVWFFSWGVSGQGCSKKITAEILTERQGGPGATQLIQASEGGSASPCAQVNLVASCCFTYFEIE